MEIKAFGLIIVFMFLLSACNTNQPSNVQNESKSTGKGNSKIETKNVSKPTSNATFKDIVYNEKLPTGISGPGISCISGEPASDISEVVRDSPEIVEVTILDDGRQIAFNDVASGDITSKARVDKVYKGSLNEGEIINVAERGGVEQVEKQGETFNIISLPEDGSQPFQSGDRAILFLYDNTEFSQEIGEKTYIRAVFFFSKFVIDPSSNTVQLASLNEYQLADFKNKPVKTRKMKIKKFKNVEGTLEYKEMALSEFQSHLPKSKNK